MIFNYQVIHPNNDPKPQVSKPIHSHKPIKNMVLITRPFVFLLIFKSQVLLGNKQVGG